jgi:acetylglutamate synthase
MALILNNITLLTQDEHTHTANKAKYCDILAILQKTKGENCIEVARVMFNLAAL